MKSKSGFSLPMASLSLEIFAKSYREPVDDLRKRNKADSKTKSVDSSKPRGEVRPGHLRRELEFWTKNCWDFHYNFWSTNIDESPKKMLTMAMPFS